MLKPSSETVGLTDVDAISEIEAVYAWIFRSGWEAKLASFYGDASDLVPREVNCDPHHMSITLGPPLPPRTAPDADRHPYRRNRLGTGLANSGGSSVALRVLLRAASVPKWGASRVEHREGTPRTAYSSVRLT